MEIRSYLYDKDFLKQIDYQQEREFRVRIMLLDLNDYPKDMIEGIVTGGSINIDGASAVRRTCSLTLTVTNKELDDINSFYNDEYWSFNHKFRLEIGVKNLVDTKKYPEILWFDQGTYIITSFTPSASLNSINVTIQGKDKMCRLNGEVSGNIPIETDFGTIEEVDSNGNIKITKLPLKQIIYNAVKEYGGERVENIVINDLDFTAFELWEYRGTTPMYMYLKTGTDIAPNLIAVSFNGNQSVTWNEEGKVKTATLSTFEENGGQFYTFNSLDPSINNNTTIVNYGQVDGEIKIAKVSYGQTAGYHQTPLVYNSDLILKAGETVTSLLDKIKNMLGNYEYFYDLQGRFVFQKKKTYIDEIFSPVNGNLVTPMVYTPYYSYKFEDYKILTAISSPPKIDNIKNEFTLWGTRSGTDGRNIPFHVRYALQKKPTQYTLPYDKYTQITPLCYIKATKVIAAVTGNENKNQEQVEKNRAYYEANKSKLYRKTELAKEHKYDGYFQTESFNQGLDFYIIQEIDSGSADFADNSTVYYKFTEPSGRIRYVEYKNQGPELENKHYKEPYAIKTTINSDGTETKEYKQVSDPAMTDPRLPYYFKTNKGTVYQSNLLPQSSEAISVDWRELIYQMAQDYLQHNREDDFLTKIENSNPEFVQGKTKYEQYYSDVLGYWRQLYSLTPQWEDNYYLKDEEYEYWNKQIHSDPQSLLFWMDFLDVKGDISNYNVDKIGLRSKVVNENSIKSIYFKETPEILFNVSGEVNQITNNEKTAYTIINISDTEKDLFDRSNQGMSAIQKINELIYQHTLTTTTISLTSMPIYYLEPNTRIYVEGYGDYTLDKISYSLNYNSTMSINGTKINKEFY